MPPALPPRTAMRSRSTSPRSARSRAASRQSSASATPHWPQSAQQVGAAIPRAPRVVDTCDGEAAGGENCSVRSRPSWQAEVGPEWHHVLSGGGEMVGGASCRCIGGLRVARPVQRPVHHPAGAARHRRTAHRVRSLLGGARPRRRRGSQGLRWLARSMIHTFVGVSGVLPISATPSPMRAEPRSRRRVARAVRASTPFRRRTMASQPADVRGATTVPSGSSAHVVWPRTQSGPWNSAAALVSRLRSPAVTPGVPGCT